MTYHTGIDVSLRSVSICVVNDKGEVCLEAEVAAEIDAIVECLHRFDRDVRSVGFEAGTLTQYLTYGLQAAGFEVILPGSTPGQRHAGGDAQQDRPQRRTRHRADPANGLVQPGACQEPAQPPGARLAGQPQGDLEEVRRSGE